MNYAKIKLVDVGNGRGVRTSLYVSGCRNHCKGCFNPETWAFSYGTPFTDVEAEKIIHQLSHSYMNGLSVLGGEPLEPENREALLPFLKKVKETYPSKPTWLYTGYLYENVKDYEIMKYVDFLVDGRFILELKNPNLRFRGSSNQRIIDVKRGKEVEY